MNTPITDAAARYIDGFADQWVPRYVSEETERELTIVTKERDEARETAERYRLDANALMLQRDEAREQRDRLAKALRECREDSVELLGERDWWQHEPRGDYQQRYQETRHNAKRAEAALQSLTPNNHE